MNATTPSVGTDPDGRETIPSSLQPLSMRLSQTDPTDFTRFAPPPDVSTRPSAVLILLADNHGAADLLLTERAATMRSHSGQPAFPGGAMDPTDASPVACALREAHEEVGVDPDSVRVLGELPELWVPVTGFAVTPVVAWWQTPGPVQPQETEVAAAHRVPVAQLADPANRVRVRHPSGYIGPGFDVAGMMVWGFTAGLVDGVIRLAGWEQPWLPGRLVDIEG